MDLIHFIEDNRALFCNYIEEPTNPKYAEIARRTKKKVQTAIADLEEMSSVNDSNSNMHFQIGVLKTLNGLASEAVQSFANAIEKSDDNYFSHYYWKGLALAMNGCFELALNEFEIAKSLSKSNFRVSLHIGTCFLLLGDLDNAYEAFKGVVGDPENEMEVNLCIGKFFMMRGFIEHAIQSFTYANKHKSSEKVLQELLKCNICDKNLVAAMETLTAVEKQASLHRREYQTDIQILEALKSSSEGHLQDAKNALAAFQVTTKEGYVFKKLDIMLYSAVVQYLALDFQSALKQFMLLEMEFYTKEDSAVLPESEEEQFQELFVSNSDREGQIFVSTKSITHPELIYNMALCLVQLKQYDKAYMKLHLLAAVSPLKPRLAKCLDFLKKWVSKETLVKCHGSVPPAIEKNTSGTGSSMAVKKSREQVASLLQEGAEGLEEEGQDDLMVNEFSIFPIDNRLCCIYSGVRAFFSDSCFLDLRLSFCLPSVQVSDIKIAVGYEELLKLTLRSIEYKPEAPWIKKVDEKIIFTNHLVHEEVEEYDSPEDLLARLKAKSLLPVNTLTRLNIAQAYHTNLEDLRNLQKEDRRSDKSSFDDGRSRDEGLEEELFPEEPKKPDLQKLKMELMLDDRTNELLKRLAK